MGLFNDPFSLITLTLLLLTVFGFFSVSIAAVSNTDLVYKGCANQTFQDPVSQQTLSTLLDSLVAQSSKSKFYKTSTGSGQSSITGLFQCRGDLSNDDCYRCVSKIPQMVNQMCGNTVAGRIQLVGCYGLYEISGFPQVSGFQMLYKICGKSQIAGSGFEERRDTAFSTMENGILGGNSNGFFATTFESVYVLGQCEGTLGSGDCGNCVKGAVQKAQVECGNSISGQIYLHKCYVSYAYYPNGISRHSFSGGTHQNTGKTIAIVVGGVAAVGFAFICLMFLRSLMKKRDGKY